MAIVSPIPVSASTACMHNLIRAFDDSPRVASTDYDGIDLDLLESFDLASASLAAPAPHDDPEWHPSLAPPPPPLTNKKQSFVGEETEPFLPYFYSYDAAETLLVLDYDNTMFPTKYFERNRRLVFADVSALPPRFARRLAKLDEAMADFVTMASERCRVAVVTAASREWITFSSFKFMPKLAAAVQMLEIDVVCASEDYRDVMEAYAAPFCYLATKREAFRELMARHRTRRIVSIGDSSWERRAALAVDTVFELDHELSDVLLPAKVHIPKVSVQIIPRSSPQELCQQFDTITNFLDALLMSDESLDLRMAVDSFDNRSIIAHQEDSLV